jgi:dihydroorotate dehydrogenase (NAD+) catalytic subunit
MNQVAEVARAVALPIVGMGGIASGGQAADFLRAGATCVAVGTESFRDPAAGVRIRTELVAVLEIDEPDRPVAATPSGESGRG